MHTYIVLLRGINVGGKGKLPMKDLVILLEDLGYENIRTYIQSGNVILCSKQKATAKSANIIGDAIAGAKGFKPDVMLFSANELQDAVKHNPFATDDGKNLHFYFLESVPKTPNLTLLNKLQTPTEQFSLTGAIFYLYAPDGIGRSKLAAAVERAMGVPATARNWNTVGKLLEMLNEM